MARILHTIIALAACVALPAAAQTTVAPVPATDQMAVDQSACSSAATQATGYVPGQTPPPPMTNPNAGARVSGAAVGAVTGGAVGVAQNNNHPYAPQGVQDQHRQDQAQAGAVAGTMVGGAKVRQGRRETAKAQQTATTQQQAKATAWENSYGACMTQRGYVAAK
ncbi:hypothetical protein EUV02_08475 [Polymorphobacter arshaanensis]|uniref:YMGG-like Gly-zipper domain-containing protein n=1 Tax=Glacieibacterium arshaanense TaxID=2511025 RepID=A0A4Y9END9_9SPHN|nr:hypothetical protein [Polymorphobacter arshaanensis]TFU03220.1 hypothetical protein EUV02_08475 [Polymorphobacter arshaanensis]